MINWGRCVDLNLPKYVSFTLDRLEENSYSAYLVGGCVRDYVMGIEPHDYDITTNARPGEIEKCFSDIKTLDVGKKHGTITLVLDKECVEVTTYRIDGKYTDNRHPECVVFTDDIELDLARRDFTMNAIAYSPRYGFCDAFGGREDIANGIIRCVGDAGERFEEDALRILRALRFASRLGFEIEEKTARAIIEKTHLLSNIAPERITSELLGLLDGKFAPQIVDGFSSVFEYLYPELCGKLCESSASLGLYSFFSSLEGMDIIPILKRMKLDNVTVKSVSNVILNLPVARRVKDKIEVKKLALKIGVTDALIVLCLAEKHEQRQLLENSVKDGECVALSQLEICGSDLLQLCSGKRIGDTLNKLLLEVIEEKCENNKNILLKRAEEILRGRHGI